MATHTIPRFLIPALECVAVAVGRTTSCAEKRRSEPTAELCGRKNAEFGDMSGQNLWATIRDLLGRSGEIAPFFYSKPTGEGRPKPYIYRFGPILMSGIP